MLWKRNRVSFGRLPLTNSCRLHYSYDPLNPADNFHSCRSSTPNVWPPYSIRTYSSILMQCYSQYFLNVFSGNGEGESDWKFILCGIEEGYLGLLAFAGFAILALRVIGNSLWVRKEVLPRRISAFYKLKLVYFSLIFKYHTVSR